MRLEAVGAVIMIMFPAAPLMADLAAVAVPAVARAPQLGQPDREIMAVRHPLMVMMARVVAARARWAPMASVARAARAARALIILFLAFPVITAAVAVVVLALQPELALALEESAAAAREAWVLRDLVARVQMVALILEVAEEVADILLMAVRTAVELEVMVARVW